METRFTPFENGFVPDWERYFNAGDAWLNSLYLLLDNPTETGWGVFYVVPTMVAMCVELYLKAFVSHLDDTFQGKNFFHRSAEIIASYKDQDPFLARVAADADLMYLIAEYQLSMNVKYGEMYVQAPRSEQALLLDFIHELRAESCRRTSRR